ncbi:uncharacterized protein F5Z01DRAFT_625841 [Emericellopsis atlantica]|uniref:DUF1996 domain-containing protein n=1 Tax=Emericellopsis atlantica TaxID=2614577 RepID=A0A9P7ZHM5_9HYPO|nr:uncharacterized protein F5Z01DRAFT_625841 [Emericellopsis atlantica]KAG9252278.1 hypothetical protein F5Z01DRAFT_625841 [Emericellopsis atlantica]
MLSKSLIAASAGLVGTAQAFWRMECPGRVTLARLDPIVNPGQISSHLHTVHGSNAFGEVSDTASLVAGDCTSCRVTQDKSAYWTPTMYFKDGDTGELEMVEQVGGMLAYYLLNGQDIKGFPADFSMIAGTNKRRTYTAGDPNSDPAKSQWEALGQTTQTDLEQRALGFNCLNYDKAPEGTLYRHVMPDKDYMDANCKDGLRLELMFPSCWDGKNAQSDDHKSHVAYPDLVMTGTCPDSHPVSVPGLLFETIWATQAFDGRNGMFVMSNGDPTGYGYHGDFIMGWDPDFLQNAVDTCTNPSGRIEDCPLFDVVSEAKAKSCELPKLPSILQSEKVVQSLSALPGNVPITYEDGTTDDTEQSPVPSQSYKPGEIPADPASPLPGQVFKETSVSVAPAPSSAPSSASDDVVLAAAEPEPVTTTTTTTAPTSSEVIPTTTAAPEIAPVEPEPVYDSTQYITSGNMVTKILWEEEIVWVTEMVDSTTTVTIQGAAPEASAPAAAERKPRAAHAHGHGHHHKF